MGFFDKLFPKNKRSQSKGKTNLDDYKPEPIKVYGKEEPLKSDVTLNNDKNKIVLIGNSVGSMFLDELGRTGYASTEPIRNIQGKKWEYNYERNFSSMSPVYYKNKIFILSEDNYLHAINAEDGEIEWRYLPDNKATMPKSSPAVADDVVYFNSSTYLYAVDANNGILKWKYGASNGGNSSPIVFNNKVFFNCLDRLYAIDVFKGVAIWTFKLSDRCNKLMSIDSKNDLICFIVRDNLISVDLDTGYQLLAHKIINADPTFIHHPIIYDGKVFISADKRSELNIIDVRNNQLLTAFLGNFSSPLTISNNIIYATVEHILLKAWEISSSDRAVKHLWTHKNDDRFLYHGLTIADDVIYAFSESFSGQNLQAFNADSGEELWKYRVNGGIICPPLVKDKKLFYVKNSSGVGVQRMGPGQIIALT